LQSKDSFRYLELELPPPVNSRIAKSAFVKSSAKVADCPPSRGFPEFAVIGRSNVGKSSLINSLTGNDKLAKVSKEPGEHREVLHVSATAMQSHLAVVHCQVQLSSSTTS
jgi:GTP-binding protein